MFVIIIKILIIKEKKFDCIIFSYYYLKVCDYELIEMKKC